MLRSIGSWIVNNWKLAVMAALLLALGGVWMKLQATEQELDQERLQRVNAEAKLDSTREVLQDRSARYQWFQRLAQQRTLERDSIDEDLDQTRQAYAELQVQVKELAADTAEADTTYVIGDSTRVAEFSKRLNHGLLTTKVEVPPTPATPRLTDIRFQLDPFAVNVRVACQDADDIQAANITLRPPEWVTIRVDSVVTDPQVCNPNLGDTSGSGLLWPSTTAAGAIGGGVTGYLLDSETPRTSAAVGAVVGGGSGYLLGKVLGLF